MNYNLGICSISLICFLIGIESIAQTQCAAASAGVQTGLCTGILILPMAKLGHVCNKIVLLKHPNFLLQSFKVFTAWLKKNY